MEFFMKYIAVPIAIFLLGYLLPRLMGKRSAAQMPGFNPLFVFIVGLAIVGPVLLGILGIFAYYVLALALTCITFSLPSIQNKFKKFWGRSLPTILVRNGNIDEKGLHQARITVEGLLSLLRQKGYTNISDLASVMMEETGHITIIPKTNKYPVQHEDLQLMPPPAYLPIPLIINGEIIDQNLKYIEKDRDWLASQLQINQMSPDNLSSVILATFNQKGYLNIDSIKRKNKKQGIHEYKPGNEK
ncbi:DUF421 domain-containing protein [Virgibacillus sp. 179-BFC.A HS]|uniref:DUF421 domain-containing protein n=1 Tax=Tigheibacillus jepli TaxID=3035914 RepID=A0ABU5CHD3_9BACI|nr:YetF domain-containing protein [Virgibacillus sp. 179-BFC.A HS]MDY0405767.1 DUF421 domain-containing protein [Virgibacillus sp. 179-BFC.A HS]